MSVLQISRWLVLPQHLGGCAAFSCINRHQNAEVALKSQRDTFHHFRAQSPACFGSLAALLSQFFSTRLFFQDQTSTSTSKNKLKFSARYHSPLEQLFRKKFIFYAENALATTTTHTHFMFQCELAIKFHVKNYCQCRNSAEYICIAQTGRSHIFLKTDTDAAITICPLTTLKHLKYKICTIYHNSIKLISIIPLFN